MGHKRIG